MALIHLEVVLVLLYTVVIQASDHSYEVTAPTTWANAVKANYKMATPEINYEPKDLVVNISYHVESKVWVGYYMAATRFVYIGCIEDSRSTVSLTIEGNTPGLCYSACKEKQNIGLRGSECFCNVDVSRSTAFRTGCTEPCPGQNGIVCGGHSFISLYKPQPEAIGGDTLNSTNCLTTYMRLYSDVVPSWERCEGLFQTMCQCYVLSFDGSIVDYSESSWSQAMETCLTNGCRPALYISAESLRNKTNKSYQLWTGFIRSNAIYKFNGFYNISLPLSSKYLYGYLMSDNHSVYVRFQADKPMPVLIHEARTSATELVPLSVLNYNSPTTDTFQAHNTSDTTGRDSVGTDNPSDGNRSEKDIIVVVGVSVGVVSFITGFVLALVILKSRKKESKFSDGDLKLKNRTYANTVNNNTDSEGTIDTESSVNQSIEDNHYEEPLSVQATNSFHNYDVPLSNQLTSSKHYEKPNHGNTIGPYESLGQRNTNTYDTLYI